MSKIGSVGDSGRISSVTLFNNFVSAKRSSLAAVITTYSHTRKFSLLPHILFMFLHYNSTHSLSLHLAQQKNAVIAAKVSKHHCHRYVANVKAFKTNIIFTCTAIGSLLRTAIIMSLSHLLMQSGDVHPNPGQASASSSSLSADSSCSSSLSILESISLSRHLSFVQYNVQSILSKLNILYTELHDFDTLHVAFSETCKTVLPMLVLLCVALWSILRGDFLSIVLCYFVLVFYSPFTSRKHAYNNLTPLNPTFI